jgi:predicted RNA binding protein YcfA (HicA-like mRNA interferase family)
VKYKDVIDLIEHDGWYQIRQRGSHRTYKHNIKSGIVTIAYHRVKDEVPKGTFHLLRVTQQGESGWRGL